jgi:hypothetical protein
MRNALMVAVLFVALGTIVGCGKEKSGDSKGTTPTGTISNAPGSAQKTTDGFCTDSLASGVQEFGSQLMQLTTDAQDAASRGDEETAKAKIKEAASVCTGFASQYQDGFECKVRENGQTFRMNDIKTKCSQLQSAADQI